MKPLLHKAYGSIPHLPGSRLGEGDDLITEGQARIATKQARDEQDHILVQEKLDGSNVAVAKINGQVIALNRAGFLATTSKYRQHHVFDGYVRQHEKRFKELLNDGERVCGEWLIQAHSTIYKLPHEPFVPFDIMVKAQRKLSEEVYQRVHALGFTPPRVISQGKPLSIEQAMVALQVSGHGAVDLVEGAIWRVERQNKVDFLTKYVRPDKQPGIYLPDVTGHAEVWNVPLTPFAF